MPAEAPAFPSAPMVAGLGPASSEEEMAARLSRLEDELRELRGQFRSAEPAINRLVRIEGDIRILLGQMERVIAARAAAPSNQGNVSTPSAAPSTRNQVTADAAPPSGRSSPALARPLTQPLAAAPKQAEQPATMPKLVLQLEQPAAKPPAPAPEPSAPPPPPVAVEKPSPSTAAAVHLASHSTAAQIRAEWNLLQQRYPAELGRLSASVEVTKGENGRLSFLRLLAGSMSWNAAKLLCQKLVSRGQYCVPHADGGEPLDPDPGLHRHDLATPTS